MKAILYEEKTNCRHNQDHFNLFIMVYEIQLKVNIYLKLTTNCFVKQKEFQFQYFVKRSI